MWSIIAHFLLPEFLAGEWPILNLGVGASVG
jgi:hypothetical protein